jgi:hypothetical protein
MNKTNHLISLGKRWQLKYAGVDANSISDEITSALKTSIANASGSHGIMPFMQMLQQDAAKLSFDITKHDGLFGDSLVVDNLMVQPFDNFEKYKPLLDQVKAYLETYPEIFPVKKNESGVSYDHFKTHLQFG